jgi:uncharacterized membrane protein
MRQLCWSYLRFLLTILSPGTRYAVLVLKSLDLIVESWVVATVGLVLTLELLEFLLALIDELIGVRSRRLSWLSNFIVNLLESLFSMLTGFTLKGESSVFFNAIKRF